MSFGFRRGTGSLALLLCVAVPLSGAILATTPSVAMADELEDLEREVREVRDRISECQATRMDSIRVQEESARRVEEERARLDEVEGRLDDQQAALSKIIKMQYTTGTDDSQFLAMMTSAKSFSGMAEAMDYLRGMQNKKLKTTTQVMELRDAQEDLVRKIEDDDRQAREDAEHAESEQREFERRLDEMRPRIDSLLGEVKARLNGSSGSAQLEEAMSFLENIDGINETQAALVRSAYRTGYAGWSRCEAWVEAVYANAGHPMGSYMSAYSDYADNCVSDDQNSAPAGSLMFASGSSVPYSHVGICVFNGGGGPDTIYVLDNEGSRSGKAITLTEWLKWQTAVSSNNGRSGWFGWGHPDGVDLS